MVNLHNLFRESSVNYWTMIIKMSMHKSKVLYFCLNCIIEILVYQSMSFMRCYNSALFHFHFHASLTWLQMGLLSLASITVTSTTV